MKSYILTLIALLIITTICKERPKLKDAIQLAQKLSKLDQAVKKLNVLVITLRSYTIAFNKALSESKIISFISAVYSVMNFLFTGDHILMCLFAAIFFTLMIDNQPQQTIRRPEEEEAVPLAVRE